MAWLNVSPTFGLVLPQMTDKGAAELAKGATELAKGAAKLAKGAKDFGSTALNSAVAKGFAVAALVGVTGWVIARIIHELRDPTVKHDVNHRGSVPPPPST